MKKILAVFAFAMFLSLSIASAAYGNAVINANTDADVSIYGSNADANASGNTFLAGESPDESSSDLAASSGVSVGIDGLNTRIRSNANANLSNDGRGLEVRLSNGQSASIRIMPSVASSIAIERLKLNVCSEQNNCTIMLKEVGNNQSNSSINGRVAYEVQADKQARILGMFNKRMHVTAEIDAETGTVLEVNKPWWAAIASESDVSAGGSVSYR